MAVFKDESDEFQRLDWQLLQNASTHLYYRSQYLTEDIDWLKKQGYQIDEFDCINWLDETVMHQDFASRLNFPDYFGHNLNALNDCLSDLEIPDSSGRVFVLKRYDFFAAKMPETAWSVLDIIEYNARRFLLFGLRLLTLVQSDDPSLSFKPIGVRQVEWNRREWLNKNRGL